MAKKLESILGLPQIIKGFCDGVDRKAYPITMKEFPTFMQSLQNISGQKLWINFINDESLNALKLFFELTFKDDDYNTISKNINAGNWQDIVNIILKINGLENLIGKSNKTEGKKKEE